MKLQESWGVRLSVSYGQDMFDQLGYPNIWLDIMANLEKWRHDIPDLPNVNFDTNPEESAEEIKTCRSAYSANSLTMSEL